MVMLEHVETPSSLRRALPMGKLTISMAILNSFLYVYQRVYNNGIFAGQKKQGTDLAGASIPHFPSPQAGWRDLFGNSLVYVGNPRRGVPFTFYFDVHIFCPSFWGSQIPFKSKELGPNVYKDLTSWRVRRFPNGLFVFFIRIQLIPPKLTPQSPHEVMEFVSAKIVFFSPQNPSRPLRRMSWDIRKRLFL